MMPNQFLTLMYFTMFMSTTMAISSSNWLLVWISMELNLISFLPIMMSMKSNSLTESCIKYFLAQALGSIMLIMSSTLLYYSISSSLILMSSMLIKLGAAPGHFWLPSVMSQMSWTGCLLLLSWQKIAPLSILLWPLISPILYYPILMICCLNATVGGLMGLNQTRLQNIMAYSSITHLGWTMSPILVNKPSLSFCYFMFYILLSSSIFILFISSNTSSISSLSSLPMDFKNMLILGLLFMSLAGLPPLTGFIPKWMILSTISNVSPATMTFLIFGSLMNLYFYMNLSFNLMIISQTHTKKPTMHKYPLLYTLAATSTIGIFISMYALIIFN